MADDIVIFGGTFNPIHHGHLILARAVAERGGFQRVTFMPVHTPPHGGGRGEKAFGASDATSADRLEMIRLAIAGESCLDVNDLEIRRPGPSFTIDTLKELRRVHGPAARLHLIVGADMLSDLPRWRRAAEVVEMAGIITVGRCGQDVSAVLERLGQAFPAERVAAIKAGIMDTPLIEISSSDIRRRVAAGLSIRYLTPPAVAEFIVARGLFRC